ncbi:MAG: type II toxin-antitoxin system HicB family antitoxin [Dehalococcoidia bacterium]|nr:type II toxin-antitoxin system HicB family antitoxin [Dehalococcoidia bacterium]
MGSKSTVMARLSKGEKFYFAECLELAVVTQGKTVDETLANLQEAVALHLEGEKPEELGLTTPTPTIFVAMELELASAEA